VTSSIKSCEGMLSRQRAGYVAPLWGLFQVSSTSSLTSSRDSPYRLAPGGNEGARAERVRRAVTLAELVVHELAAIRELEHRKD